MKLVKKNQKLHNPDSPLLIGDVREGDVVKEVNEPSFIAVGITHFKLSTTFSEICSIQYEQKKLKSK